MARRRSGIVLVVVLFFALLLASTVATFARIALIDHMIVKNRDARSRADALARGGIRLATALLLEDKLHEENTAPPPPAAGPEASTGAAPTGEAGKAGPTPSGLDHHEDLWARVSGQPITFEDGSTLRIQIEDAGAKLNLNAAVAFDEEGAVDPKSVELLTRLFDKVTGEMFGPNQSNPYDPAELAANLIDYIDKDPTRQSGGEESETYLKRIPPAVPADAPLLTVDELRRVEGFDARLVDALRPYVTVYPYRAKHGGGINPNTAPPHVLSLLFFDDEVQLRLADEDTIRSILQVRKDGGFVCGEGQSAEGCTPIRNIVTNAIFPEPSFSSDVFVVTAFAQIGDVARRVEAVVDRSEGAEPRLLSWRVL
jgi:type II secretory pathway component PulK